MKKCFKCEAVKPLDDFYKHAQMADGRVNKCKECNKKDVTDHRNKNIERIRKYDKERALLPHRVQARADYAKTSKGKESGVKAKIAYSNRNPIKKGASTMVGNAVRDGKLIKPSNCSNCGIDHKKIHGHHDDYAKPLDVRWLCSPCHNLWHKENGEGKNG